MKKILLLAVFLLAIGLVAGVAEDKPLTLSGSVDFSIGDDDIAAAPGPAFSGAKAGAAATFKLGSASDKVEAGITIGLVPDVAWTDAVDADPALAGGDSATGYEFIQKILDWYTYQMADEDYVTDGGGTATFPVVDFTLPAYNSAGLIEADGDNFVVEDIDNVDWTATISAQIQADYIAIAAEVATAIQGMSAFYTDDGVLLDGDDDEVAAATAEQTMWEDYYDYAYGEDADAYNTASLPITNAYLKVKKVFGVVDIMAEIEGNDIGVGSMVTSVKTSGFDANYGVSLALSEGVVPGLSASVLVTGSDADMAAEATEDLETAAHDTADAVEPVWGAQLDLGYATKMFGANVQFGAVDLADIEGTWMLSVMPFVSLADIAGLSLKAEFNLVPDSGMALAAKLGASIMGISPSVAFYWKNEAFAGDDSVDAAKGTDDLTVDGGLMAEFNSVDQADASALAIAASVDLASVLGMKLVTLSGGFDMMLAGAADDKDFGWNVGVGLDFAEVLKMPVTLAFNISQWAAVQDNPLLWSAIVGYTYDKLGVTFTVEQTDTDVVGWSLAGTVAL